ncbi:hypothetical protein [Paenibacillus antarcticus]|nr:hypothetical protein [Paenibacillus antarcticus]
MKEDLMEKSYEELKKILEKDMEEAVFRFSVIEFTKTQNEFKVNV